MSFADFVALVSFMLGVGSALVVAFHPNILYAAVALIFSLFSVAGMYALLGADFLAAAQLVIYVGAVIVVILFAVMMTRDIYRTKFLVGVKGLIFPILLCGFSLGILGGFLARTPFSRVETLVREPTTAAMGRALVGPYALVFEYVAIVLLAGLIGAVVIARPDYARKGGNK